MFRIGSSNPIFMKPSSYVAKLKHLQESVNNEKHNENFVPEEEIARVKADNFGDKIENIEEKGQLNKVEGIHDKEMQQKKDVNFTDEYIEKKMNELVTEKIKEYLNNEKKDEKKDEKKKEKERSEEYYKLKELFESKLNKIDEIAQYIKIKQEKEQEQKIETNNESIKKDEIKEEKTDKIDENKEKTEKINEIKEENINTNLGESNSNLLMKKRARKTYTKIDDQKWDDVKKKYPKLKDDFRKDFFYEQNDIYIDVKGRKKLLNEELINNIFK